MASTPCALDLENVQFNIMRIKAPREFPSPAEMIKFMCDCLRGMRLRGRVNKPERSAVIECSRAQAAITQANGNEKIILNARKWSIR